MIDRGPAAQATAKYDTELEKAHAYALYLLLIPYLLRLWFNLVPFFKRVSEFQVDPDGFGIRAQR